MSNVKQYVFFDFEMLCSDRGMAFDKMEGIRLGAVKYDLATEEVYYFDQYIRPKNRRPLSAFCKTLTGIDDADLKEANDFSQVFEDFLTWVGGVKKSRFFSWSTSDLTRLKLDANLHNVPTTTLKKIEMRYIDFQAIFTKRVSKTNPSVEKALWLYGLDFIGDKHNPMYDAYNTLRIYLAFLNRPIESDRIMLRQFVFNHVPSESDLMNEKLKATFKEDMSLFIKDLKEMYKMKDAIKVIKKTRQKVKKYENILINRSGLFSKDNVKSVELLVQFYHELLLSYDDHFQHSSKVMILDESIFYPINNVLLKRG